MIKKILLAHDGSELAEKAFTFGLDLAKKYGAELYVLAVARPPEFGGGTVEAEAILENYQEYYQDILEPLKGKVAAEEVKAHFEVAVGHPAEQIVYHADKYEVDLIIVGHRGHTVFKHWLLGSVANHVINNARCAVLVAR